MIESVGNAIRERFTQFSDFIINAFTNAVDGIKNIFNSIPEFVRNIIKIATSPITSFMDTIRRALAALRNLIRRRNAANSNNSSNNSSNNNTGRPMAAGGVVSSPELIYAGEAGSEYIVPARKAGAFSRNYLAGMRGSAAIPRFADGGYISRPNVNITTGAVTQMDGTNFITTNDLTTAVQSGIDQTLNILQSDLRARRALGLS